MVSIANPILITHNLQKILRGMHLNRLNQQSRWVTCLDLLGTRALLKRGEMGKVLQSYQSAIRSLKRGKKIIPRVKHVWFSDTFLLIAPDNSGKSFTEIDLITRLFSSSLLHEHIPFRGAMACGPMHADFKRGIYCGLGMVEAYEYGECQDWIGLILCPSAKSQLASFGIDPDHRLNWQKTAVPWKSRSSGFPDQLPAYIFGQNTNGSNACLDALKKLRTTIGQDKPRERRKYSRTIKFIENNLRRIVKNHNDEARDD